MWSLCFHKFSDFLRFCTLCLAKVGSSCAKNKFDAQWPVPLHWHSVPQLPFTPFVTVVSQLHATATSLRWFADISLLWTVKLHLGCSANKIQTVQGALQYHICHFQSGDLGYSEGDSWRSCIGSWMPDSSDHRKAQAKSSHWGCQQPSWLAGSLKGWGPQMYKTSQDPILIQLNQQFPNFGKNSIGGLPHSWRSTCQFATSESSICVSIWRPVTSNVFVVVRIGTWDILTWF